MPNLSRKVLEVLRTADKPLTASEITWAALENGGMVADATTQKVTTRKIGKLLDHHRRRGLVVGSDVGERMLGWTIIVAQDAFRSSVLDRKEADADV